MFPEITPDPLTGEKKMKIEDFYNFLSMHGEVDKEAALRAEAELEKLKDEAENEEEL